MYYNENKNRDKIRVAACFHVFFFNIYGDLYNLYLIT